MTGRPVTATPRLADLVPAELAASVATRVADHVGRLVLRLGPAARLELDLGDGAEHTDLGLTVQDLVAWTQRGEGDADEAWDAAQSVCSTLYSRAGEPGTFGISALEGQGDAADPLGVVLLATHARYELAHGRPVTPRALGALAGVSKAWMHKLAPEAARSGRARGARGIPARQAHSILAARVVGADDARTLARAGGTWRLACGGGRQWLVVQGETAVAALATQRGWTRDGTGWVAG